MDARITKQRLANMLAYDWLKIVGMIALAAVFFSLFFTMIATRATDGQTFYVYAFNGLTTGSDFSSLTDDMDAKGVFGYDILRTGSEAFSSNALYGNSVYTARRSAGEGRVMFVNDVRTKNEDGTESSKLLDFLDYRGTEFERFSSFLDPEVFLTDCKKYLTGFFGEDLSGEPNQDKVREAFMARNGKDKRFRTSAKKEAGVKSEVERLIKIRDDYLLVEQEMGQSIDYMRYTTEQKEHTVGLSMRALNLTDLIYYTVKSEGKEVKGNDEVVLCLFNNGTREGDLRYETVNFIAYILREYGGAK